MNQNAETARNGMKKNLACVLFGHIYAAKDITTCNLPDGKLEFIHTCCRCGDKKHVVLDEQWLCVPWCEF